MENVTITNKNSIAHKHGIPILKSEDDIDHWLFELSLWQDVTDVRKVNQASVVFMSLPDKMRRACANLNKEQLRSDEGLTLLLDKRKGLYAADKDTAMFIHYEKFEKYNRKSSGISIIDYINEFERLYAKIKEYKMELPSAVLACKLLINADLPDDKQIMARTTVGELTFENMKRQLKAIHDISGNVLGDAASGQPRIDKSHSLDSSGTNIKKEPTFVTDTYVDPSDPNFALYNGYDNFQSNFKGRYRGNQSRA